MTTGQTRLLSVHWTLDPNKNSGCYYMEGARRVECPDPASAYAAFRAGHWVRSEWYDVQWRKAQEKGTLLRQFRQENDLSYNITGASAFDETAVRRGYMESTAPEFWLRIDPSAWADPSGADRARKFWEMIEDMMRQAPETAAHDPNAYPIGVWETPRAGDPYVVFGDTAEALTAEDDNAAFAVVNCRTGFVAATGRALWQPHIMALVLCAVGYWYNEALMFVENNAVGMAVLTTITGRIAIQSGEDIEALKRRWLYRRLATEIKIDRLDARQTRRIGVRTSAITKRQLVTSARRLTEHTVEFCRDQRFWDELAGFAENDDGSCGNPAGDDLAISVMGANYFAPEGRSFPPITLESRSRRASEWRQFSKNINRGRYDEVGRRLAGLPRESYYEQTRQ